MTSDVKEQKIQKDILDFLRLKGFLAIKQNNIGIYARAGVPDIICCSNQGKFIGIEVKRPGQKPRAIQKAFLDSINQIGGVGFYATSVNDVIKELTAKNII